MERAALKRVVNPLERILGLESESAKIPQHSGKNAKGIVLRQITEGQHDGWIKRGDVAVPNVLYHAGDKDIGVTAFKWPRLRQVRNRMTAAQILAKEQCVNLGRISADDNVLVVVRENLSLDEIASTQD